MTAGMCVPLVVFLSSVRLHSVSAGGERCAKTARARAAALGLDPYAGVQGAPDLYGPAHHGSLPSTLQFRHPPYNSNDDELAETAHLQDHPRSFESAFLLSHGPYNPVQSDYTTDQVLRAPRGQSVINRQPNFEEVKHVAPLTPAEARGPSNLVNWGPQGRSRPLSFVDNERDLVVDESVPNRLVMSSSGLPLPRSWGHGGYQRGLNEHDPRREVPVRGSSGFTNKEDIREMTGRGPAAGRLRRLPGHRSLPRHRSLRRFIQGYPVFRHMTKPNSGPVRISHRAEGV